MGTCGRCLNYFWSSCSTRGCFGVGPVASLHDQPAKTIKDIQLVVKWTMDPAEQLQNANHYCTPEAASTEERGIQQA